MGRRKTDLKLAEVVVGAIVLLLVGMIPGWLLSRSLIDDATPAMLVCSEDPHSRQRRCPPEVDVPVLGYWNDGSSATVRWDGRAWRLVIPGGRGAVVNYPQTWRDLASE